MTKKQRQQKIGAYYTFINVFGRILSVTQYSNIMKEIAKLEGLKF